MRGAAPYQNNDTSPGSAEKTQAASSSPLPSVEGTSNSDGRALPAPLPGAPTSMGMASSVAASFAEAGVGVPTVDAGTQPDCDPPVSVLVSQEIPTVATVTVTPTADVANATVEFGLGTEYGQVATLEHDGNGRRATLWGLRANTEYHFRVTFGAGERGCNGEDRVFTTGAPPESVPKPRVQVASEEATAPGFLVTSVQGAGGAGSGSYMVIYDHHGEPVWWYESPFAGLVTRTRLSWDTKYVFGRDGNPSARAGGSVVRVSIDGSQAERLDVDTGHHDMAATPDNGILFLVGGGRDGCSRIQKWSEAAGLADFYDLRDAFGAMFKAGNDPCHCNSIQYNQLDASVTVSCLTQNAFVKLSSTAELIWVLGGNNGQSHFTGDVGWNRQHGHHLLSEDRILFFNNNGAGDATSSSSLAVELQLDASNGTATRVWEYDGGETSQTLGDVQRLPNGNTLVTYSNAGLVHEVDSAKSRVQTWDFGGGVGYAEHRPSSSAPRPTP